MEYLRRKILLEAVSALKTELFKDSAEIIIPASFPPVGYAYDPIGNITTKVSGPTTLGYTYHPTKKHAVNSITVNGTPYAFEYDLNGNMTNGYDLTNPLSIVTRSMSYNADNMPTVVTRNGVSTTLAYDGEGARVKKVGPSGTTYYIGDHYEVINGDTTKYIFAGNLRIAKAGAASGIYYFHKNHLGSSSAMTTVLGSVQEETNYMPFGEQREHTGLTLTNYKFTDQELDPETGLYNYGARLYDAVTGRFISADTIVLDYANPQSLNRYSYTLNNPLIYVDPSGHFSLTSEGIFFDDAQYTQNALYSSTASAWSSGDYGVAAMGAFLYLGNLPNYAASWAMQSIVAPGNATYKATSGFIEEDYDKALKGSVETLLIFGGARLLSPAATFESTTVPIESTASKGTATVFRQGTFADEAVGWEGNVVKGKQWATDNPLTTPDYAKRYGLPAENTGKPDWVVGGRIQGPYTTRPAPPSYNNPANAGGAIEVLPQNPNNVMIDWFHMP